jgi:hypothetical protein
LMGEKAHCLEDENNHSMSMSVIYSLHVTLSLPVLSWDLRYRCVDPPRDRHCPIWKMWKVVGQKIRPVATRQMHSVAPHFEIFRDSAIEPLLAMTLVLLPLEHTPSVPQGVGSDKLIKDVRMIMYLVCTWSV